MSGKRQYSTHFYEIIGALTASLVNASVGILGGYAAIALPELNLDKIQASWFASMDLFLCMIFAPIGGLLSGWLGRKKIMLAFSPLAVIGWVLIATQTSEWMLFSGRFLSSIAIASMMASSNVYIAETVHPDIRASLASLPGFAMSSGLSVIWILRYFWSARIIAYISAVPPFLCLIMFCFLPETPYWLIEHDLEPEAVKSLQFFRLHTDQENISKEILEIQLQHLEKKAIKKSTSWNWTLSRLCSMSFLKPFGCIGILSILTMLSGLSVYSNYLSDFMDESGSNLEPSVGQLSVGIIRLIIVGIVPYFVQEMPPRLAFTIAHLLIAVCLSSIATFYYFNSIDPNSGVQMFNWVPMVMFVIALITRGIAFLPIQHILLAELFPTEIRTLSVGIVQFFETGTGAIIVKMYPEMKTSIGICGICYFFAAVGLLVTIWAFCTIPDNRSKTLIAIEKSYDGQKSSTLPK